MKNLRKIQTGQKAVHKSIKAIAFLGCLTFVFGLAFAFVFSGFSLNNTEVKTAYAAIDPSVYNQNLNSAYYALAHGSTYTFTDKTKVDDFRSGRLSEDTTTVTVDRRQPHGSQQNPYVIDSIDGNSNGQGSWNKFVSEMANTANSYGSGKYFVLKNDLDWQSGTKVFNKVLRFDGNLYGLGHSLKNIVYDGTNTNNGSLFSTIQEAVLADLILNDYTYNNVVFSAPLAINVGTSSILNCHMSGRINRTTASVNQFHIGGMIFSLNAPTSTTNQEVLLYRCSTKLVANGKIASPPKGGTLCGGIICSSPYSYKIYDCCVDFEVTFDNPSDTYSSLISSTSIAGANNCKHIAENVVGTMKLNNMHNWDAHSIFMSGWIDDTNSGANNKNNNEFVFSNIYADVKAVIGSTTNNVFPSIYYAAQQNILINKGTKIKSTNLHYVNGYTNYTPNAASNFATNLMTSANATNGNVAPTMYTHTTTSSLWSAAQTDTNLKSNIWNKSSIGSTISATNNPVINPIGSTGFTAKFYNYKNGSKESIGVSDITNYSTSTTFPTPTAPDSNQKFVGWTMDLQDDEHIYDVNSHFTSDIYGDVEFYAVWDVNTMATDTLTADKSTVEYLLGNITLTASISATNMMDATVAYKWKHGTTALGDTSSSITKENVSDSGTYTLEYYIKSQSQPLWRHRGTHSETITITPGTLTPQSMTVDKTAYYGMTLSELAPTVVMHNSQGNAVNGTAAWRVGSRQITKDTADPNYQAGKAYAEFTFVPDSSYNGNYGTTANYNTSTTAQNDIVYFNVNELTVTFNTASIFGTDLSFVITSNYGDPVTYRTIATQFEQLYAQFSADNPSDVSSLTGKTPQLKLNTDSQFYNINDYKAKSGGYNNVRASISIDVAFTQKFYSVTYKFDDGVTPDKIEGSKSYGQLLIKPSPDPTNGTNSFLGWFYPELDASGNPVYEPGTSTPKLKKWDFDVDRIVDDLVLTARWLQADSLDHIEVVAQKPSYNALDPLKAGDLTVTAYYNAKDSDGNPIVIPIPLSWSDYSSGITYVGNRPGDNVLHVDPNGGKTKVDVFYSFFNATTGTTTDTVTVELVVDPIKIDLSALNLQTQTVAFNGSAKSYDLTLAQIQALSDPNVSYITGINFTYYLSRNEVQPADVKAIGNYDVVITFTTSDADYAVDPINVQLRIVDQSELPDPPGPGPDPSNGTNLWDKIVAAIQNGFPLWQIATIAVGGILSIIFLIKSIQYGNRKKKAKGEAKKISTKTYAGLLPVFATDIVLAGLSNQIWSIIAFAMVGVTVLMFLIAIITRKGWKKAELAKEEAIEDREQRKFDAQEAKQLAFQERVTQVAQNGQGGIDSSIIEEMRREMEAQRRADEERHRQEMEALREEQAKRDEAMKIMLANMMGRQQGADGMDMGYASMDNTDLLVQKVIAGLLPMVQQMVPEPTAYLAAPNEQNDRYDALMSEMSAMRQQLDSMSHNVYDAEIISDNSDEIRALKDEHSAQIAEQNAQIAELQSRIAELSQGRVEAELLPDQTEEIKALNAKIEKLQQHIADGNGSVVAAADNSEELRAMADAQNAKLAQQNAEIAELRNQIAIMSSMSVDELDDEDFDDEEEWDSILDEDDDDFVEAVIIDDNGKERKVYPNFRMRLKQSSDKNREWYAVIKNLFCSQKGVTYRVYKRVEKIRYQGQVIAVIGIAKRSIKLWLALKPYEYDARRYHHKDVSDKPRFVDVPMYVRITSDRALDRSQELILALFQELNMEARKRYTDRPIQELIFTLKHNRLLTNKQNKQLLCEVMHVHDCDILDDETAEKCIEAKNVEFIDDSNIETVKLDDIDAKFQDGNRVTLDRLKKVGLVSEDCTGFTVTADKRLTKPLIIVANDFSLTAVKLITLTGGRAIRLQTV